MSTALTRSQAPGIAASSSCRRRTRTRAGVAPASSRSIRDGAITSRAPSGKGSTASSRPSTMTGPSRRSSTGAATSAAWNCAAAKPSATVKSITGASIPRPLRHAAARSIAASTSSAAPSQRGGSVCSQK